MDVASKAGPSKIINDPIWGPIELHPLCVMIIDTPQFQRLRSIKQMGGCCWVYPGACHTRFEHSIGTSYLAGVLGRELQRKTTEIKITKKDILCLEVAGLCHDLGHGPFSHMFDQQFITKVEPRNKWKHEDNSIEMIGEIFKLLNHKQSYVDKKDIRFIKNLIKHPKKRAQRRAKKTFLFEIIANDVNSIDVDKWDYFSRDCHMLGFQHNFQVQRMIKLARVVEHGKGNWHISFPKTEFQQIFDMFYTRFAIHRRACLHPVVKAVEMMITDAFREADSALKFPSSTGQKMCLSKSKDDMDAYLWVTDDVLHQIKTLDRDDTSPKIRKAKEIVNRIERRKLYKLIGEKRVKMESTNASSVTLKKIMDREMKKKGVTSTERNLFEIQVAEFSYGKGKRNPMTYVKLYKKIKKNGREVIKKATMTKTEISDMFPVKFEQKYIRLYWKGTTEHKLKQKKIKAIFSKIKGIQGGPLKLKNVL